MALREKLKILKVTTIVTFQDLVGAIGIRNKNDASVDLLQIIVKLKILQLGKGHTCMNEVAAMEAPPLSVNYPVRFDWSRDVREPPDPYQSQIFFFWIL